MKGFVPLVLGIFGTFAFSWVGLILIPNLQIGHLDPQSDEEGTDIYPMPQSGMAERGRHIYAANGCVYCHSEQLRAEYAGVSAAAPRAITFSIAPCSSGKSGWVLIFRTSEKPRPRKERTLRQPARLPRQLHRPKRRPKLHPRLRPRLLQSRRIRPLHRHFLRRRPRHRPRRARVRLLLEPIQFRPRNPQVSPRVQLEARLALNQNPENHCRTPPPGTIGIFIHRAVSRSTRTCRPTVFFMKSGPSPANLPPTRSSSLAATRHQLVGRSFPPTMRNASSRI